MAVISPLVCFYATQLGGFRRVASDYLKIFTDVFTFRRKNTPQGLGPGEAGDAAIADSGKSKSE